jgi:hypothetical protein
MKTTRSIPSGRQALNHDLARSAMASALGRSSRSTSTPPLRVEPAATPIAPWQMAAVQSADAAAQEQLAASYEACLRTYRDIARAQFGATDVDDVGAVMAFFVAINLHALHGVDVGASAMQPLERQLRSVTRLAANWDVATRAQRQCFFERIAILSILVSRSLADAASQEPAAMAHVRQSAREYLQHVLGLNPDLVTLGADGLAPHA